MFGFGTLLTGGEEANKILYYCKSTQHPKGAGCVGLYGGGIHIRFRQIDELKKGFCQIVAGTPGRVVDLTISGSASLNGFSGNIFSSLTPIF
jgi:superfamily II DNA/RNA helicase